MDQIPLINYDIISEAISHYQNTGFQYIDVPWMIDQASIEATKPPQCCMFTTVDGNLVGSGEQSYIALHRKGVLAPGKYICVTPCFRDELAPDDWHFRRFLKAELIDCRKDHDFNSLLESAIDFFSSYLPVKTVSTHEGIDIVTADDREIELGSYGFRTYDGFNWIYGTAVAEPRLSQSILLNSYHLSVIRRAKAGTPEKIIEEAQEYIDAQKNSNPVMGLIELSDIIGSVECLLEQNHPGITLNDLVTMSNATRRAFKSGHR